MRWRAWSWRKPKISAKLAEWGRYQNLVPKGSMPHPVLQSKLCHQLPELLHVTPEFLDFIAGLLPGIHSESLLSRLQELLAPFVVQVLVDAFSPAELCDCVFPLKPSMTIRIFSSAEYSIRVLLRMFLTVVSADVFFSAILHSL